VQVKSQTGCVQTDTIELKDPDPITWNLTTSGIKCFGDINGAITINDMYGGNNVYYFSLDGAAYFKSNGFPWVYDHLPAGNHLIKVKDENGCESEFNAYIAERAPFKIQLSQKDTTIQFGDSIRVALASSTKASTLHWYPKDYVNCDSCNETTIKPISDFIKIKTIAIDSFGCVDSASILIRTEKDKKVYIPNIFYRESTNQNNNIFKIFGSRDADLLYSFRIFDRWGNLVYEENNTTLQNMKGWDGTSNGKIMNPGIYIYQAEVGFKDNTKAIYKGDVMLYE
jgi:gliding motility-associated-like protein